MTDFVALVRRELARVALPEMRRGRVGVTDHPSPGRVVTSCVLSPSFVFRKIHKKPVDKQRRTCYYAEDREDREEVVSSQSSAKALTLRKFGARSKGATGGVAALFCGMRIWPDARQQSAARWSK